MVRVSLVVAWFAVVAVVASEPPDSPAWIEAERLRAEGSYALALERYRSLDRELLPDDAKRWLALRTADVAWRSALQGGTSDPTALESARLVLEELGRDPERESQRDRVWAESHESLGDLAWYAPSWGDWGTGWRWYHGALTWWGSSRDIDLARRRWMGIVRKAAEPRWLVPPMRYPDAGGLIPPDVAEQALAIARDPRDVVLARYLVAVAAAQDVASPALYRRAVEAFEAAAAPGPSNEYRDDALWRFAQFVQAPGRPVRLADGGLGHEPDYEHAVRILGRLVAEFPEGTSRFREPALRQIEEITRPALDVAVPHVFVPGSEIEYVLSWRNADAVELRLVPVRLPQDVDPSRTNDRDWLASIDLADSRPERRWSQAAPRAGQHAPQYVVERLTSPPTPGAYVLEASAGDATSRALVLITRTAAVLTVRGGRGVAFVADAFDGAPRARQAVTIWQGTWDERGRTRRWSSERHSTDADGLVRFDVRNDAGRGIEILALCGAEGEQAWTRLSSWSRPEPTESWAVYAFADRPAYRPGDTAHWKWIARLRSSGGYRIPAGDSLRWTILDPRGAEIASGTATLSDLGGAWGEVQIPARGALGEYALRVAHPSTDSEIAREVLFRVEEYRLPEFQVTVTTPRDELGRPRALRAGEPVPLEVRAEYYFGGAVSGADVEVIVREQRFDPWPRPSMPYGGKRSEPSPWFGPGGAVQRLRGVLDAEGRAGFTIPTTAYDDQDRTYAIEARVTDAARREVVGVAAVRVTRQPYFAFVDPARRVQPPNQPVRVVIRTVDPNDLPVAVQGRVTVVREQFEEIWTDPWGRKVEGAALDRARREAGGSFPPPAPPGRPEWRLVRRGARREVLRDSTIATDAEGRAEFGFTPERDGLYRVLWLSEPQDLWPVQAESSVWIASDTTASVAFRGDDVQIVVDRDAFRVGEVAVVLITTPWPGAAVLFSVDPEDLHAARVVRLTGDAKLLELPIDARHVPNLFLEASAVLDLALHRDVVEVKVPPEEQFVDVQIDAGPETVEPGSARTVTLTARDRTGAPVEAEIAVSVVDEAVYALQPDYAPDPRSFFLGRERSHGTTLSSSFDQSRYVRLEPRNPDDEVAEVPRETFAEAGMALRAVAAKSAAEASDAALAVAAPPPSAASDSPAAPTVRADFRATAYWQPDVRTGADGKATVTVPYPESLTAWSFKARAAAGADRFGLGEARTRTSKALTVRLQSPRFLTVGDTAVVSLMLSNATSQAVRVAPHLTAEGVELEGRVGGDGDVEVPPIGERRVEWQVRAVEAGPARLVAEARGGSLSDAVERRFVVEEHGVAALVAHSGKLRTAEATVTIDLPPSRRPDSTSLVVQVTPSAAAALLDALPYLVDYPYGCTEQTLSRFVPAVIVRRALTRLQIDPAKFSGRLARLDEVTAQGSARLLESQRPDGSWGWWPEGDPDPFMTTYALWGLSEAVAAGVPYDRARLADAARWIETRLVVADPELRALELHALSSYAGTVGRRTPTGLERAALDASWNERDRLGAYGRAALALAHHRFGDPDRAAVLARNLANGVVRDEAPDRSVVVRGSGSGAPEVQSTAHWGRSGVAWRWSEGAVESTAFVLRALLAIDPSSDLVEPAAHWLVRNRRGAQWSNTRDTAIAVLALTDWLERSGEVAGSASFAIHVNGREIARTSLGVDDVLKAPARFEATPADLRDGPNEVRITRTSGEGALYFAVEARFVDRDEPIPPRGHELFVERAYLRLAPYDTLLAGPRFERVPLADVATTASGERVEVVLTLEAKNDLEYVVLEDRKPAGFEAVELRSGGGVAVRRLRARGAERSPGEREEVDSASEVRFAYRELRDRHVALFIDRLPQGLWELRYELRAETPGAYHALPVEGFAMYVPEIRGNGSETRVRLEDRLSSVP